jgi:hypothetical protein
MTDLDRFANALFTAGAGGTYLTGEDNFRLTTWGAVAGAVVVIEGRIADDAGCTVPLVETQIPQSDRSAKVSIFPAREGLLLNIQARVSTGTAVVGAVGVLLELVRGRDGAVQPLGTLLQGYATSATRLAWPGSGITPLTAGAGRLRAIVGTDPAANVEISEAVPTGARWKLRSFRFVLVADANVANRAVVLTIDDGANVLFETASAVAVTAGQTATFNALAGSPFFTYGTLAYHIPLPPDLVLPAGARVRTVTANRQVGDNYGAPTYLVEEYIEQ